LLPLHGGIVEITHFDLFSNFKRQLGDGSLSAGIYTIFRNWEMALSAKI
jgi:hypothetical protein